MAIRGQKFRGQGHFKVTEVITLHCSVSVRNVESSNEALVKFNKSARAQNGHFTARM